MKLLPLLTQKYGQTAIRSQQLPGYLLFRDLPLCAFRE